jgi:hypothetical protein
MHEFRGYNVCLIFFVLSAGGEWSCLDDVEYGARASASSTSLSSQVSVLEMPS